MSQTTQQPPPGRVAGNRGNPAMSDIVRSVLVLAVALLVVVGVGGWFRHDTVVEPEEVDVAAAARHAADQASFPVLVPSTVPDGWRATQAEWDPSAQHWHLGLLTGDDEFVGVDQIRDASVDELVDSYAAGAEPDGEVDVAGSPWRVYVDAANGRTALVTTADGVTTMVLGSLSRARLGPFAETLAPLRG
jgi:Protein of unknown function (DUF4245)